MAVSSPSEILAFRTAEIAVRGKHWIAGVPTSADLAAVDRFVAHRLMTTVEAVHAAVDAVPTDPVTPATQTEGNTQ